jgi:hypothetical protein
MVRLAAVALLVAVLVTGEATASGPAPVDREAVADLLGTTGVERRPPRPQVSQYLRTLALAVSDWVDGRLEGGDRWSQLVASFEWLLDHAAWLVRATLVVALAVLSWVLVGLVRRRRRRPTDRAADLATAAVVARTTSPEDCWHRLQRALEAGAADEALGALWWWLAIAVVGEAVDGSWTSGDLVRASGRRDLVVPLARFDAMVYGRRATDLAELRRLADELRGVA